MNIIAFDTETYLIQPGRLIPRCVCVTFEGGNGAWIRTATDGIHDLQQYLRGENTILVGQNVAYDVLVCCEYAGNEYGIDAAHDLFDSFVRAVDDNRIRDTKTRQRLINLARGILTDDKGKRQKYSLDALVQHHLSIDISASKKGDDVWRLRYRELDGIPLEKWPTEAVKYAVDDAYYTREVYLAQAREKSAVNQMDGSITNEREQVRASIALTAATAWGLRTDRKAVEALEQKTLVEVAQIKAIAQLSGLRSPSGRKNMKAIKERVMLAYASRNEDPPLTDKGAICTDAKAMEGSGDPLLQEMAESKAEKLLSTYLPALWCGVDYPLNPSYTILLESGRTSSSKPNIQNPPRRGGVRECFVPRPGNVYLVCDYAQIELCGLAQCLRFMFQKESSIERAIKAGKDLHVMLAANMMGKEYEDYNPEDPVWKNARQVAKVGNYGFPGGLGAVKFVDYARGMGVETNQEDAYALKNGWFETWPEMMDYFNWVNEQVSTHGWIKQFVSNRVRGGVTFCEACNTLFQGIVADGALFAAWNLMKACYLDGQHKFSDLYGSRVVAFLHDEFILEVSEAEDMTECGRDLEKIMCEAMARYIGCVPIKAEAIAMRRWYKGAKPLRDADDNLYVIE